MASIAVIDAPRFTWIVERIRSSDIRELRTIQKQWVLKNDPSRYQDFFAGRK
jgi:hypothetical protein